MDMNRDGTGTAPEPASGPLALMKAVVTDQDSARINLVDGCKAEDSQRFIKGRRLPKQLSKKLFDII